MDTYAFLRDYKIPKLAKTPSADPCNLPVACFRNSLRMARNRRQKESEEDSQTSQSDDTSQEESSDSEESSSSSSEEGEVTPGRNRDDLDPPCTEDALSRFYKEKERVQ